MTNDLISKEETLKAFSDYVGSGMSMDDFDALWDIVAKMPPVKESKTGHWIIEVWNNKEHHTCSNCQHVVTYEPCYHYCPYCGAKMVEPQERGNKE